MSEINDWYADSYDEGYEEGFEVGLERGIELADHRYRLSEDDLANKKMELAERLAELAETQVLLKAALEIWDAYEEDQRYTPSRVQHQASLLEEAGKAGKVKGWKGL